MAMEWANKDRYNLPMVYLSLVCHCPGVKLWWEVFRHGEMRVPTAEGWFWRGRSDWPCLEGGG
jgi:hypothetical protein